MPCSESQSFWAVSTWHLNTSKDGYPTVFLRKRFQYSITLMVICFSMYLDGISHVLTCVLCLSPIAIQAWEQSGFVFPIGSDQVAIESSKVSHLPSLLKAEQAQLSTPLHVHRALQPATSSVGLCWPHSSASISLAWATASVGFPPLNWCGYEKISPFWHNERDAALIGSLQISDLNKTSLKKKQQITPYWNRPMATVVLLEQSRWVSLFSASWHNF